MAARRARGVLLDISLTGPRQEGPFLLLRPGGEIDVDPRRTTTWPLESASVLTAVVSGVVEQVDRDQWFDWWNELHRVCKPKAKVYLSGPYGGEENWGFLSDPRNRIRVIESTLETLDPRSPFYAADQAPNPWFCLTFTRVPAPHGQVGYNAILEPQPCQVSSPASSRSSKR